jgi:hypothetical protein
MKRFNWQIWTGFLLSIVAFFSYPTIFVMWPVTRDFPWVNLLLFAIAIVLLGIGVRRAFAPNRRRISKIVAPIVATLGILILGFFIFVAFIASRWLPASLAAPQVGQKAPDFTLTDMNNKPVSLSELLTRPMEPARPAMVGGTAQPPKGVLLVFYRGYW